MCVFCVKYIYTVFISFNLNFSSLCLMAIIRFFFSFSLLLFLESTCFSLFMVL